MNLEKLEKKLADVKREIDELIEARSSSSFDRLTAYEAQLLDIERNICKLKQQEYVIPISLGFRVIDDPILIASFGKAMLFFNSNANETAVLKFNDVEDLMYGGLNDEAIESHQLLGHGLDTYGEYIVMNSIWKDLLSSKNKVHACYDEKYWEDLNHYLIRTKSGEFGCLASSFELTVHNLSVDDAIAKTLDTHS